MAKSKIHVGLDIGASKTLMVVGECFRDGRMEILGTGTVMTPPEAILKGEVNRHGLVTEAIQKAWHMAQESACVDILSVFIAANGKHIQGANEIGSLRLGDRTKTVTQADVDEVCERAREVKLSDREFKLHALRGKFRIDKENMISMPQGLAAKTLDVQYHIICGLHSSITNTVKAAYEVPLHIDEVVFTPIADAYYILPLLGRNAPEEGILILDIGASTTTYAMFHTGNVVFSGCIPIGGDNITRHIAKQLSLSFEEAEFLKKTQGTVDVQSDRFFGEALIPAKQGKEGTIAAPEKLVSRQQLSLSICDCVKFMFDKIEERTGRKAISDIGYGVVLCGGSSQLHGIDKAASDYFQKQAFLVENLKGQDDIHSKGLRNPACTTALGLLRYAQRENDFHEDSLSFWKKLRYKLFNR